MKTRNLSLGELQKGVRARIVSVTAPSDETVRSFLQMGLLEGSLVRIVHQAPLSGDPIVVEVRGALIALRRNEAAGIGVEVQDPDPRSADISSGGTA